MLPSMTVPHGPVRLSQNDPSDRRAEISYLGGLRSRSLLHLDC